MILQNIDNLLRINWSRSLRDIHGPTLRNKKISVSGRGKLLVTLQELSEHESIPSPEGLSMNSKVYKVKGGMIQWQI